MEVPRLGVESELPLLATATVVQDLSCVWNLHHGSGQCWILNSLREAKNQTRILMDTVRFITTKPQWELLQLPLFCLHYTLVFYVFYVSLILENSINAGMIFVLILSKTKGEMKRTFMVLAFWEGEDNFNVQFCKQWTNSN